MGKAALTVSLGLLATLVATVVMAQHDPTEAPSAFQQEIDDQDGGLESDAYIDPAAEAQAVEIEKTGSASGLSRSGSRKVEEIVVRARKRAELLEATPLSVTALSPDQLREANVTNINQIQNLVPNVTFNSSGLNQQIRIRGVGSSSAGIAFDPGVGLYLDGVFLPRSRAAVFDLVDVQQVEVLRGPQGTLFGKNTVGGAVNVTTVKPQMFPEASILIRPGSQGILNTRAMVNIPIGSGWLEDRLATRLSVGATTSRGYVYNATRDTYQSNNDSQSFVGSVRFLPIDDLTIDVSGSYAKIITAGPGGQCRFMVEQDLTALAPGLEEACNDTQPFVAQSDTAQLANTSNYGTWGIIRYEIGDLSILQDVSVKSLTSWRQRKTRNRTDLDGSRIPVVFLTSAGGPPGLTTGTPGSSEQIQQELQVNAAAWDGRINFVTGLFTYWEKAEAGNSVPVPLIPSGSNSNIKTDNSTWALYGQGTANVTDWLSLTAGIRYTSDSKSIDQLNKSTVDPDLPSGGGTGEKTFTSWTPAASIAFTLPEDWLLESAFDHLMTYFTYARGFKGGGINAAVQVAQQVDPQPFDPETLDNFELGIKTIAFDRGLTMNVALFHAKYDDIQVTQQRTFIDAEGNPTVQRLTLNAAKATTQGAEVELQAVPLPGMAVTGSLGYLDTRFGDFPNALSDFDGSVIDRTGESFNSAPRWQSYLAIQQSFPLSPGSAEDSWLNGWITPRVDWAYRGRSHVLGPEVPQGVQRGYSLVGAYLSYTFMDTKARVALWGQNLLDEEYFADAFSLGGTYGTMQRWFRPSRTFGGEVSYRFD